MRKLSRCLLLFIAALSVHSCFIDGEITGIGICFFISLGIAVIAVIASLISDEKEKEKENERANANKIEDKSILSKITAKYGTPDKVIYTCDDRVKNSFMMFLRHNIIYAESRIVPFEQLSGCEIIDEAGTRYHLTSDAVIGNNGSVIGRSIAGGILAGSTGAVIGGLSANTNKPTSYQTTTHHYFALINLTDLNNPIIRVDCGEGGRDKAEEIRAIVMNITRNHNKPSSLSIADELNKLSVLMEQGVISQEEFNKLKEKLL